MKQHLITEDFDKMNILKLFIRFSPFFIVLIRQIQPQLDKIYFYYVESILKQMNYSI